MIKKYYLILSPNHLILSSLFALFFFSKTNSANAQTSFRRSLDATGAATGHTAAGLSTNFPMLIGRFIFYLLSFVGVIFLVLMIYGGYIWMMARGNEQDVEKAKTLIKNSLIGLIIILCAYAITYMFLKYFAPSA